MGALMHECEHGADGSYSGPDELDGKCSFCEIARLRAALDLARNLPECPPAIRALADDALAGAAVETTCEHDFMETKDPLISRCKSCGYLQDDSYKAHK
jgi:hypothetical protein